MNFASHLAHFALTRESLAIPSSSPHHGRYMIKKLFDVAESEVRILTGRLTMRAQDRDLEIYAWPPLIESAQEFLRQDGNLLRILAENEIDGQADNTFLHHVISDPQRLGTVEVATAAPGALDDHYNHFLVADSSAYRLETDKIKRIAIGNFNDPERATALRQTFDRVLCYLSKKHLLSFYYIYDFASFGKEGHCTNGLKDSEEPALL